MIVALSRPAAALAATVWLLAVTSLAAAQTSEDAALAAALLQHSNAARASAGVGPLAVDAGLTAAAEAHAREMAQLGFFGHTSPVPANATLGQRVANVGSPLVEIAENLARMIGVLDADVAERTVQGWLDSPGHRQNLLNASFNRVGFGLHRDPALGLVIVQVLGWEPFGLAEKRVASATRVSTEMVLRFDSRAMVEVVLSFGGGSGTPLWLPAGVSDVVLLPLSQDTELGVGVRQGRGFVFDDGATLHAAAILASGSSRDPASARGTFTADRDAPRRHTRLIGA